MINSIFDLLGAKVQQKNEILGYWRWICFAQQMLTNAQPLIILSYPNWDHYIPFTQKITVVKTIDDLVEKIADGK
jgi:hypothetical protein